VAASRAAWWWRCDVLSAVSDADAAGWVTAGVRDFDGTVGSVVPAVFEAYARVFHPASRAAGASEVEVCWAEVAAANARAMHPAAEWGSLTGSWQSHEQPGVWEQPPRTGELPRALATRLAAVLAGYTKSPECSYFALWDGWGVLGLLLSFREGTPEDVQRLRRQAIEDEIAVWRELVQSGAEFTLPGREMRLLRGPLTAIEEFYELHHDPPSLWWPGDRAWCVGTDIDLMSTYVGGSSASISAVLADDVLEALPVSVDQGITWETDTVNPPPAPPR
jgi:hypothetical protein